MILLEVIANSVEDCVAAEQGGADRIELCSALALGGLTPSLGLLIGARRATRLPIMAMNRPRAGGFCYTESEFSVMCRDADLALAHGADGLVFGCLLGDGTVDAGRTRRLVERAGDKQTVFHRAFDVTPNPFHALDVLMDLGVTRVLTSGQMPSVVDGTALVAALVAHAAGRIQILPGGGITIGNARAVVQQTQVTQIHASLSGSQVDTSTQARPDLHFSAVTLPAESHVRITDCSAVTKMRALLDQW
jgi:copper homeostasis protein